MNSGRNSRAAAPRGNQIFFWALTGDHQSLRAALEGGMSVNVIDPVTTDSPLMIACRKGHTDVVRLCLEYGAKNDPHPEFGQTALHASVTEQKLESARVLLQVAADSDADHIISNLTDPSGQTPLHAAAYIGTTAMVELLLHHGAELSSVDAQGQTALHLCASSGVKICLAMLLDHGGDDLIDIQDNGGNTALHHATFNGRLDCVRLLLETAADVAIRNYEGLTAYNIASTQGHHQIGLLLYEYRDVGSGTSSANPSNLPTPSKPYRSSQPATPLPYQTPMSSAKYGPPHQDYPYSPSTHMHDFADDHADSPERQIRLNIQPVQRPQQQASGLNLKLPTNPLSSMYGSNGGMENLDSMGSFLPRPHNVNSPSMSNKGGLHAAALRGQNSARGSPSNIAGVAGAVTNNYNSANPMLRGRDDYIASNLTYSGMVAHNNHQHAGTNGGSKGAAITSPLSPNSEPEGLENGNGSNGYKVLPKQSGLGGPPSLSRQSSESIGSKLSLGSDAAAAGKMQLFDGIQTYTKSSIIANSDHTHQRRYSSDSPLQFQAQPVHGEYGDRRTGQAALSQAQARGAIPASHSASAMDNLPYNQQTQSRSYEGSRSNPSIHSSYAYQQEPARSQVNFMDHHMESIAATRGDSQYPTSDAAGNIPGPPQSTPQKSTAPGRGGAPAYAGLGGYTANTGNNGGGHAYAQSSEYDDAQAAEAAEYSTEVAAESTSSEFAEPIEEFSHLGREWKVYYTEDQQVYYLDMAHEHSQWEDPREFGIRYFSDITESPTGRTTEPPKSPSPKAIEKSGYRTFQFNSHNADMSEEESPRVRDIKPIKLNWDGKPEVGIAQDHLGERKSARVNGRRNGAASSKALRVEEFSSDSSDNEVTTAVKVRFPGRRGNTAAEGQNRLLDATGPVLMTDADAVDTECESEGDLPRASPQLMEQTLDLNQITLNDGDPPPKTSAAARTEKRLFLEEDAPPLFQRSNSDIPFESKDQLEKGRIRLLTSQYEKAGGKPLSPATSAPLRSASFYGSVKATTENVPRVSPVLVPEPVAATQPVVKQPQEQPKPSSTNNPPAAAFTREDAEPYVSAIVSGKSMQEVYDQMDRECLGREFKLQVLAWADEALLLVPSSANGAFTSPSSKDSAPAAEAPVLVQETVAMLKEDALLGKYAKMLSMGVPAANVLMKLKMENVELTQRNRLMRAAGQEVEPEPTSGGAATAGGDGAGGGGAARRPSANLQNLHWNTLPADKLKHSIWAQSSNNASTDLAETDLAELERLFGAQKSTGSFATTRTLGALADSKETLQLKHLEKKRGQNIVIGLNPFKSLGSHVDVLKALCSLDDMGGKITADSIDNFRSLLPTEAELKRIDKIQGSKHPAEMFFQAVMLFYPELPLRLTCFGACLSFPSSCAVLQGRAKKLINACNQVLASNNLTRLLQRMLAVGNIMNEGTRKGGASGFTLDSLMKMVNTKGLDKKTSVLDYVVKSLYDKQEESMLSLLEDLNLVEESARSSGTEVIKEFAALRASLDSLEQAYAFNQGKSAEPAFSSPTARKMVDQFSQRLEGYLSSFQGQMQECERSKAILTRKVDDIVKYFGEDSGVCDTTKIFGTLQEFLRAVAFSKAAVEWKLYRSQSDSAKV